MKRVFNDPDSDNWHKCGTFVGAAASALVIMLALGIVLAALTWVFVKIVEAI